LYVSKIIEDPSSLPFILSEDRLETHSLKDAYLKEFSNEISVLMEVSSWEVIANLTVKGLGIGFFSEYVALSRAENLREVPFEPANFSYSVCAISQKRRPLPAAVETFLEKISESISPCQLT